MSHPVCLGLPGGGSLRSLASLCRGCEPCTSQALTLVHALLGAAPWGRPVWPSAGPACCQLRSLTDLWSLHCMCRPGNSEPLHGTVAQHLSLRLMLWSLLARCVTWGLGTLPGVRWD